MSRTKNTETHVTAVSAAVRNEAEPHPLYASQPAAGFPAPGDDMVERPLDLNDLLIENPTATFFVRVSGDSMEGARIFEGDVLVVDRSVEPKDGKIVVAAVYGELVVKRLRKTPSGLALISENEEYSPILIDDVDECYVWGVVVGTARAIR